MLPPVVPAPGDPCPHHTVTCHVEKRSGWQPGQGGGGGSGLSPITVAHSPEEGHWEPRAPLLSPAAWAQPFAQLPFPY